MPDRTRETVGGGMSLMPDRTRETVGDGWLGVLGLSARKREVFPVALRRFGTLALALLAAFACIWAPGDARTADPRRLAPDFTLSDQNGHAFTLSRHRGRPVVLFFGYTHCPDVCPTILANLKHARTVIGPKGSDVMVALITVDPSRDTAAALRDFVSVFDPSFVGLRGSNAQLAPVYRAYNVRLAKQPGNESGYLVSHTAFVYYIGRDGRVRSFGTWNDPQDILQENLREIVSPGS